MPYSSMLVSWPLMKTWMWVPVITTCTVRLPLAGMAVSLPMSTPSL